MFPDHRYAQWQEKLGLFGGENGLIRCKGRIENADVPYSSRNSVLLPKPQPFTDLLLLECHRRVVPGVKETRSELRSRFWIIRGRQVVDEFFSGTASVDVLRETPMQLRPQRHCTSSELRMIQHSRQSELTLLVRFTLMAFLRERIKLLSSTLHCTPVRVLAQCTLASHQIYLLTPF